MTTVEQIKAARNALYDALPIGEVGANAFDLIKLIKEHLCKLDEIVDTTPSPDVAGSDGVAFGSTDLHLDQPWNVIEVLNKLEEAASILLDKKDYDGHGWEEISHARKAALSIVQSIKNRLAIQQQHPQPAGASVAQLCPKCQGQGIVSRPPWIAADVESWSGNQAHYECDVCNGNKILKYGAAFQAAQVVGVRENIENALYGTGRFNTDECDQLTDVILAALPAVKPAPAAVRAGTWRKASDGLPNLLNGEPFFKVDGEKADGCFLSDEVFEYHKNSKYVGIEKEAFNRVEWLDESAPDIPDVRELVEALERIARGGYTGADYIAQTALAGIKRK